MVELTQKTANDSEINENDELFYLQIKVYGALVISECVLASLLVVVSVAATFTFERWRKNFRNQLLMQLTFACFFDRIINMYIFFFTPDTFTDNILLTVLIYIDLVLLILIIFFIKHMYESVIIVVVKVNKSDFYKVTGYSWLLPIPIVGVYGAIVVNTALVDGWTFYLITCVALRWPVMIVGTALYLKILLNVLNDRIRYYAKDLTIITFLVCLVVNAYSISEDVKKLWSEDYFHLLLSVILGLTLDILVACLYVILLIKARHPTVNNVI